MNPQQQDEEKQGRLFPLFLKLAGRKVVVVGGGKVAIGKVEALQGAGAEITVVAPAIRAELVRPGIRLERREFSPADLDGAWLAIAAAPAEINRQVASEAERRRIFVNAVDDPAAASAYTGGVFRRGGVTVAISTDGAAPALAGLLREALDALLPVELESWVNQARELRKKWRSEGLPIGKRRPQLLEALNRIYQQGGAP
jgi:uroporphyrin-III C-methyltransferase/precorrin-2 dehydrogenase/sirohydrochlorin ferrochelatase